MDGRKEEDKVVAMAAGAPQASELPYVIELWDLRRTGPERVIGRAANATVARAVFTAAQTEHLGRRIVLRHGDRVVAES